MKIIKHAQSCFLVDTGKTRILIDPGTYVFEKEGINPVDFSDIDILIFTHEHRDHCDPDRVPMIIQNNQPIILATEAVIDILKNLSPSADFRETGNRTTHSFLNLGVKIFGLDSTHGPLPNGKPAPAVSGVVIDDGTTRLYVPGDTIELNEAAKPVDIVAVPICGVVVMDIETAKSELQKLMPRLAIPYHFDNPDYPVKPEDFIAAMDGTAIKVNYLKNNDSFDFGKFF